MRHIPRLPFRKGSFLRRRANALLRETSGTTTIITALAIPVLIGLAGLGTEAGYAYMKHSALQSTAGLAAISAANAVMYGAVSGATDAKAITAAMGYQDRQDGITVTVNSPPLSGPYTTTVGAIEVIVSRQQQPLLMSLFRKTDYTITGRSVSKAGKLGTGNGCAIALERSLASFFSSGTMSLTMSGCDAYVNSSDPKAATLSNNSTVNLASLNIVGNISGSLTTGTVKVNQTPIANPYADLSVPTSTTCDYDRDNRTATPAITIPRGTTPATPYTLPPTSTTTVICGGLSLGPAIISFLIPACTSSRTIP